MDGRRFYSETNDSVSSMDESASGASDKKLENGPDYMTLEGVVEKEEPIKVTDVMDKYVNIEGMRL